MANRVRDWSGVKFGKLTAIKVIGRDHDGRAVWLCSCECGGETTRTSTAITLSIKKEQNCTCGCEPARKTHGLTRGNKNLYWVWSSMIQRCENENSRDFANYGARGISVDRGWRESFANFYEWAMSSGYRSGVTIERVDVNGNYCPKNCTWIVNERQAFNTTRTNYLTHRGETKTLSDWANEKGLNYKTLRNRIFTYGWSIEEALETKVGEKR